MQAYPSDLIQKKAKGEKITILTAYDAPTAALIATQNIDAILVGDSLANVIAGLDTTLSVTLDQMIYHTQMVKRGAPTALILTDMPYLSYTNETEAIHNATRLLKEGGAAGVKIEATHHHLPIITALINHGIPVLSHVGFTPQYLFQLGGYKIQGKTEEAAQQLKSLCRDLEKTSSFGIVLEMIPSSLAKTISKSIKIPTIGIGAGPHCDGQILVTSDLLGLSDKKVPKFVKPYATLYPQMQKAISKFKDDVEKGQFPDDSHSF